MVYAGLMPAMHRPIGREPNTPQGIPSMKRTLSTLGEPETEEAFRARLEQALLATNRETRALISQLRTSIPQYAEEFYCGNAGETVLQPQKYSSNILRITSIIVNTPSASTLVVMQLGFKVVPLPSGLVILPEICTLLRTDDIRRLTITPSPTVQTLFWLMGEQLPQVDL